MRWRRRRRRRHQARDAVAVVLATGRGVSRMGYINHASLILWIRMSTYILLGGGFGVALLIAIWGIWRLR